MNELKRYFKKSGMSQYRLAQLLGIDRSAVTHWVKGKRKPARAHLAKLAEITGIPIENLL